MGLKITDWRVTPLLDRGARVPNKVQPEYLTIYGIEGFVDGDGWTGMARDDDGDQRMTFDTEAEAEAKIVELRRQFPA